MGLFTPKYPKPDTPSAAAHVDHATAACDALNRMFDADARGDTATADREMRTAQRHIDDINRR
jgi:hypothetical protein